MASQDTYDRLTVVFRDVFDDEAVVATAVLSAEDVEEWDSLANVRLFLALEQSFGVRFSSAEMTGLANVGELAGLLEKKRASR